MCWKSPSILPTSHPPRVGVVPPTNPCSSGMNRPIPKPSDSDWSTPSRTMEGNAHLWSLSIGARLRTVLVCIMVLELAPTSSAPCKPLAENADEMALQCSRQSLNSSPSRSGVAAGQASHCSRSANGGSMRRRGVFVGLLLAVLAGPEWLGVSMRAANDQQAQPQRTQPPSTDGKLNIIAFGAHPDDCDQGAGGVAAKYAALGHRVRCVSVTNGDAGHQTEGGGALAARRRAEAQEAGRRIGIEYVVLDNHDGELLPTLAVREQIIRQMRQWNADLVLAPRPNDYHPDHRYTGILV